MCFHFSQYTDQKKLSKRYSKPIPKETKTGIWLNGFEHPEVAAVLEEEVKIMRWGLVPGWIKNEEEARDIENKTLNARAETLFEKPSFKDSVLPYRCLIPATGFFEWQTRGTQKIPFYISLKNQELFSFAGIYNPFHSATQNKIIHGFSLITVEANSMMADIHNTKKRMPLILAKNVENDWLNPELSIEDITLLCTPFPAEEMKAHTIFIPNKDMKTESAGLLNHVGYHSPGLFDDDSERFDIFQ